MPVIPDGKPKRVGYYRGGGKPITGSRLTMGPWAHLDDETRVQYEAIEARVRDKVAKGLL